MKKGLKEEVLYLVRDVLENATLKEGSRLDIESLRLIEIVVALEKNTESR